MTYFHECLQKWSVLNLWKALECDSTHSGTYKFVTPGTFVYFESGVSLEVSSECNADFVDKVGENCDDYAHGCHNTHVESLVYGGATNANGILETGLNCPKCGCWADGAENLNDLLADPNNHFFN